MSFGRVEAAALAAIVCGATIGFLRHNYHPAKIFMGDTGALTLGFVLGALAVEGVLKTPATIALAAPLLIMAVPILDTSFVVAKRLKYKRRPWAPDQNHFYHRFLRIGFTQRRTAAYLHAVGRGARRATRCCCASSRRGRAASGTRATRSSAASPACSSSPARCGWSTSSRSSRRATSRPRPAARAAGGGGAGGGRRGAPARERARLDASRRGARSEQLGRVARRRRRAPASARLSTSDVVDVGEQLQPALSTSRSSTPPSRPSNIDHTGVPSAAASRFIEPPADTSASANATSERASIARGGHDDAAEAELRDVARLLGVADEHDGLRALRRRAARAARGSSAVSAPPR